MNLSGLTDYEYAVIIGHFNGLNVKDESLKKRGYSQAIINHLQKSKATNIESLNLRFTEKNIVYPYFSFIITTYQSFKHQGILPFTGCLVDQPAKIIEIFNLLDALNDEQKNKAQKEQERVNKKNGRHRR